MNTPTAQLLFDIIQTEAVSYYQSFQAITNKAKENFENREWHKQRLIVSERDELINLSIDRCTRRIFQEIEKDLLKVEILDDLKNRIQFENQLLPPLILKSYFNALSRQVYPDYHLGQELDTTLHLGIKTDNEPIKKINFDINGENPFNIILKSLDLNLNRHELDESILYLTKAYKKHFENATAEIEYCKDLFFRNQHAYLIGSINFEEKLIPFAIPFINDSKGIKIDGFLTREKDLIRIFEFTRSYFLVRNEDPESLLAFLIRLMPTKQLSQLIINLGLRELGKSIQKSEYKNDLNSKKQKLNHAPGIRGMVMIVFTAPEIEVVFKVIREKIPPPKEIKREEVIEKYQFISRQDRVGRLADAQLYKRWTFKLELFDENLLQEFKDFDSGIVEIKKDRIIFSQIFTERKMIPLNLFMEQEDHKRVNHVINDYGRAIKELAMSNLFPGDLLLKNFGVTSDERVVFYDYDEAVALTECNFRSLPIQRNEEEYLDREVYLVVEKNDIFPEELEKFLIPSGVYRDFFREIHGEIYTVGFWDKWKKFHLAKQLVDLQPY